MGKLKKKCRVLALPNPGRYGDPRREKNEIISAFFSSTPINRDIFNFLNEAADGEKLPKISQFLKTRRKRKIRTLIKRLNLNTGQKDIIFRKKHGQIQK